MKHYFHILFFASVGLYYMSCNSFDKSEVKILTYGIDYLKNDSVGVYLELSAYNDFNLLSKRIYEIGCNDSLPIIVLRTKDVVKHIRIGQTCGTFCVKYRNVLRIVDEKIQRDKMYELDSIASIVERHYFNPNNSEYYSEIPQKAIYSITYDKIGMEGLPNLLDIITRTFDNLSISENLYIRINYQRHAPSPPPTAGN